MIVTIVTFTTPPTGDVDTTTLLKAIAPDYLTIDGLRRKYFIGNDLVSGGVYEWSDRSSAERYFDAAWRERMSHRYGEIPEVQYFELPCLVDNISGQILIDP